MPKTCKPLDEVVEDKGVKIFIDPKAILFLIGTEMDFVQREARRPLRVQQPEPDRGLRLRRERFDHARDGIILTTDARACPARGNICRPA